jgi:hypothetical protein
MEEFSNLVRAQLCSTSSNRHRSVPLTSKNGQFCAAESNYGRGPHLKYGRAVRRPNFNQPANALSELNTSSAVGEADSRSP